MKVIVIVPVGPAQPVGTREPVSQSPLAGSPVPGKSRVTERPHVLRPHRGLAGGEAERGLQQVDGIADVVVLGLDVRGERGEFGAEDR